MIVILVEYLRILTVSVKTNLFLISQLPYFDIVGSKGNTETLPKTMMSQTYRLGSA